MLFQLAFPQLRVWRTASFSASFYPKYSPNPFTFSQTKEQKEWVASWERNKVLGKLMLYESRVQRPGRPNLLAIWNIIQKSYFHLMSWNIKKKLLRKGFGRNYRQIPKTEFHDFTLPWYLVYSILLEMYPDYIITFLFRCVLKFVILAHTTTC